MVDLNKKIDFDFFKKLFDKDKNSSINSKAIFFLLLSIIFSSFALYYSYLTYQNNLIYQDELLNKANLELEIKNLNSNLTNNIKSNEKYFENLFASAQTDDELGEFITRLANSYKLKLNGLNFDTKVGKQKGIHLEVSGSYFRIIKFNEALKKTLASSQVINVSVNKINKSSDLLMKVEFIYQKPPDANILKSIKASELSSNLDKSKQKNPFLSKLISFLINDVYADTNNSYKIAGFVETEENQNLESRDPFSEPKIKKIKKNTVDNSTFDENDYYLSGTLISLKSNYCIVVNPYGETMILKALDKLPTGIIIREISENFISTASLNNSNIKEIRIGEQIK